MASKAIKDGRARAFKVRKEPKEIRDAKAGREKAFKGIRDIRGIRDSKV
jgi:hypothetical protein